MAAAAAAPVPVPVPEPVAEETRSMVPYVYTHRGKGTRVEALVALPDNHILAGNSAGQLYHWNLATNTIVREWEGHTMGVKGLATMEGGRLASAAWDKKVKVWDLETGACTATLEGHTSYCNDVVALPDGRLASAAYDNTVRLWDPRVADACTATLEHADAVNSLLVLPDGRLASSSSDHTVKLWDVGTAACADTLRHRGDDAMPAMGLLPDGRLAVAGSWEINVWNLATSTREARWHAHSDFINDLAVLPSGLIVSSGEDNKLCVWDPITQTRVKKHTCAQVHRMVMGTGGDLVCGISGAPYLENRLMMCPV